MGTIEILILTAVIVGLLFIFIYFRLKSIVNEAKSEIILRNKKRDDFFREKVKDFTKQYEGEGQDDKFEELYDDFMDKINSTEMNDLLANIDEIKSNYKMLLGKLMEISPGNTVLFTTKEEKDEFMKNVDVLEINSKISQDIINTLPILADFIDVQKKLSNIDDYLMKVCDAQYYLWLSINETDREKEEQRKACLENCLTARSTFIGDIGWYAIKSQVPIYDNDNDRDAYMEIVYTDGESTEKWVDIWIDKFRRISRFEEKVSEFKKIRKFYGDIEQEFGRPDWLISLDVSNSLDYNSSFHMNGSETKEELMRIRELYISGKIKGVYTKYKDPKYAK